jgi:hypothetical protein
MKIKNKGYKWIPLQRAHPLPPNEELIQVQMHELKIDRAAALARLDEEARTVEFWINDLYQVQVRRYPSKVTPGTNLIHLNIRRRDGEACIRDWRHFQQIKNELIGPECEAIELYPAESRHVDTSNKYHLWGTDDPTFRYPVGFEYRDVRYEDDSENPGLKQRPTSMRVVGK